MGEVLIKGTAVHDTLASMREGRGDAALRALLASLRPEHRAALEEPILVTAWYPLDAYTALIEASILADAGDTTNFSRRAERVVEAQLTGVYRLFARLAAPEALVKRVAAAHRTYFSGTEVEVVEAQTCQARVRYRGFTGRHRVIELAIAAFYRKALELSGARDASAVFSAPISDQGPYAEVVLRWAVGKAAGPRGERPRPQVR